MVTVRGPLLVVVVVMLGGGCDRVLGIRIRDVDAGIEIDAPPPPPCLADSFDAPLEGTRWNARLGTNGATAVVSGSNLELVVPAGIIDFVGISSVRTYDLTGGAVSVELPTTPSGGNTELYFTITRDPANYYLFDVVAGQLYFAAGFDGQRYIGSVAYDPVLHRFWQLRHDVTTDVVAFDTSPDGTSWEQRHAEAVRASLAVMQVGVFMNSLEVEAEPQTARLGRVRMNGPGCSAP